MNLAGEWTDPRGQGGLEVEMDILEGRVPGQRPGFDFVSQSLEPRDQFTDLRVGQQPGPTKPANVGDRARDVVGRKGQIDVDRACKVRDPFIGRALEPPTPEPHPYLR